MIRISKPLPGELSGEFNPEDFGFEVIADEPLTAEEEAKIKASLYRDTKERTGIVIPELEHYLGKAASASAGETSDSAESPESRGEEHNA
jgi:hypothetical protein